MPTVSVIIPVYKVEPYLDNCVQSVLDQTYTDFEVILVDDGSPDRCGEMCDGWAERDTRVRVIHQPNGGLSAARNAGIDAATGEYLAFSDSDDLLMPTYLEYLLSLFGECPEAAITACNHIVVRGESRQKNSDFTGKRVFTRREAFEDVLYHGMIDVSAWAKMYRRSVFGTLRYPVDRLYEDTYMFGDLLSETSAVVFGGEPQYLYIQRGQSIVNGGFSEKRLEFLDAVERLTEAALACDPALADACERRRVHAYLSVLRYMDGCDARYVPQRDELRRAVLERADAVLKNPRTPKRDKVAIRALRLGCGPFFLAWRLYSKIR